MFIVSQNKQRIVNLDNIVEIYAKHGKIWVSEVGFDNAYEVGDTEDEIASVMKLANALVECNEEVYCIE